MVKQIASDVGKQARNLVKQIGVEVLKTPGEIGREAASSVGLGREEINEIYAPGELGNAKPNDGLSVDQKLSEARSKMHSLAQGQKQKWEGASIQASEQQQKRVEQIVQVQLGHVQETKTDGQDDKGEKKKGLLGELAGIFKGKKGRRMTGVGQAKKDSSGEFGKTH